MDKQKAAPVQIPLTPPALLRRARDLLPTLPIKKERYWIAVLNHNIINFNDIKDDKAFLWLKAHPDITVRTIKFKYFERYPLDEFVLQHDGRIPGDFTPIGKLKNGRDNVVVFHALVVDHIKDRTLKEDIKNDTAQARPGDTQDAPIALDDDEDALAPPAAFENESSSDEDSSEDEIEASDNRASQAQPELIEIDDDEVESSEPVDEHDIAQIPSAPSAAFGNILKTKEFEQQAPAHADDITANVQQLHEFDSSYPQHPFNTYDQALGVTQRLPTAAIAFQPQQIYDCPNCNLRFAADDATIFNVDREPLCHQCSGEADAAFYGGHEFESAMQNFQENYVFEDDNALLEEPSTRAYGPADASSSNTRSGVGPQAPVQGLNDMQATNKQTTSPNNHRESSAESFRSAQEGEHDAEGDPDDQYEPLAEMQHPRHIPTPGQDDAPSASTARPGIYGSEPTHIDLDTYYDAPENDNAVYSTAPVRSFAAINVELGQAPQQQQFMAWDDGLNTDFIAGEPSQYTAARAPDVFETAAERSDLAEATNTSEIAATGPDHDQIMPDVDDSSALTSLIGTPPPMWQRHDSPERATMDPAQMLNGPTSRLTTPDTPMTPDTSASKLSNIIKLKGKSSFWQQLQLRMNNGAIKGSMNSKVLAPVQTGKITKLTPPTTPLSLKRPKPIEAQQALPPSPISPSSSRPSRAATNRANMCIYARAEVNSEDENGAGTMVELEHGNQADDEGDGRFIGHGTEDNGDWKMAGGDAEESEGSEYGG